MRILHTAATYAPSLDGVAEIVRNISERLALRGHEVHVATATVDSHHSHAELSGVHVHRFNIRGNLAFGMHGDVEKYREFVRSGNWDILVNHCLHNWPTDALLHNIGIYPWPSVLVTQGLLDEHPSLQAYYSTVPRHLSAYFKWVRVSNCTGELSFAKRFNIPVPPVITNGVDMNEWRRPPLGLRQAWDIGKKLWVLNISNHSPVKNHGGYYKLADCLRNPTTRFTLIAGTYPMNRWGLGRFGVSGGCAYQCRLRAILPGSRVDLRLNIPRYEVVSAIQEADVIVSTSRKEANSVAILEGMAAGKPWVCFDVGSARENQGGIVARNLNDMADITAELLRNAELRNTLGAAGRAQVAAKHDWDKIVDQYEELYDGAAKWRTRSRGAVISSLDRLTPSMLGTEA